MRKEDLKEYRSMCEELNRLDGQREQWISRAERSTRAPAKTPVLGGAHDPMPHIMDRLSEIREEAGRLYGRLCDAKLRIERAIERLPSAQRQVMRARYIEGKCWDAVAEEMHYDERHLRRIHDKALLSMKFLHSKSRKNKNKPMKFCLVGEKDANQCEETSQTGCPAMSEATVL